MNADAGMLNQENGDMMAKQTNRTLDLANEIPTVQKNTGKYLGETTEYFDDDKVYQIKVKMTIHHNPGEGHKLIHTNLIVISMKEEKSVQITSDRKNDKSISCSNTPLEAPNSEKMTTSHPSKDLEECLDNNGILKTKNDESNNSEEEDNAGGCLEGEKKTALM
ncbi:783_t:CDS:2 [Acaulospora morrowiae]|uniref:783_t:CDS:1 n=1 Tax=Acaulospora morrowiae TaxID=94023 RepID=A0A9N9CD60_9GLOM|nr:783_t:CDS:2 [Acaulospora morrowiae]